MIFAKLRREYNLASLRRGDLEADPIAQFEKWFDHATGARAGGGIRKILIRIYKRTFPARPSEANAAALATAGRDGQPSVRTVLLKGLGDRGFIFFTNYNSRKARDLSANPRAALLFYWADQERQVHIEGEVEKMTRAESEAYFRTRPRGSRLAAWASDQSAVVEDRAVLELRRDEWRRRYANTDVPMPEHWGGYVLHPMRFEFWQGRPDRLHDRFCYTRQPDKSWRVERLCP